MSNSSLYPPNPEEERPEEAPASRIPQDEPDSSYYLPTDDDGFSESSETAFAETEKSEGKGSAIIKEIAETLVLAILIFFTVRAAVQNFKVEGSSMEPSLHNNQYLLVNKLSYVSVEPDKVFDTVMRIPVVAAARLGFGDDEPEQSATASTDQRLFPFGQPKRGDIVVFRFPRQPTRDFIKRIVALPGEQVEIKSGIVYVNGQRLAEPYILENSTYTKPAETVPLNHYYVLGDNRNNSSDSHVWGAVPIDNIVGRAWFTYWPWKQFGLIPGATFSTVAP